MILLITGNYLVVKPYSRPKTEFLVSHGVDLETGHNIVLPQVPPGELGGKFDDRYGEWVLYDDED